MKTQLQKTLTITALIALGFQMKSQVNPTARNLPIYENFGATTYSVLPLGFATGMVSGAPVSTQAAAQTSIASSAATTTPANATQINGGSYGYAASNNAKFYVQHSSSTTTGTNDLIMAINTTYWHNILLSFDITMLQAEARTIGLVLQYRVGTTGSWTNVSGGVYSHNSTDRTNGQVDTYINLALPATAEYQPVVQLRWASWRGTQTGSSSGAAIDNVAISASPMDLPTNVSASEASSCSQLFLSEIVSDTTGNFGVEIYNPTNAAINLSGYYLTVSNGTNTPAYSALSGTIQTYSTFVVVNGKSPSSWLRSKANLLNGMSYNYDNVIGLVYSTNPMVSATMIDAIGDPNGTPTANGWTVTALGDTGSTKNHDLVRVHSVSGGNLEWSKAQYEWFAHPRNTYGFLDFHNSICHTADDPDASFVADNSTVSIPHINGSNTNTNMNVSLTGEWGTDVYVQVEDSANSSGTISFCSSNTLDPLAYTYGNMLHFPADTSGFAQQPFAVTIHNIDIDSNEQFICFAIIDNSNGYDIGTNQQWTLKIDGPPSTAGIQNWFKPSQIKIYPNPFNDQVTIMNNSQSILTKVTISDLLGREVLNFNPEQTGNIVINTQSLNNGAYFLKIYNNSNSYTVKLIKQQ